MSRYYQLAILQFTAYLQKKLFYLEVMGYRRKMTV